MTNILPNLYIVHYFLTLPESNNHLNVEMILFLIKKKENTELIEGNNGHMLGQINKSISKYLFNENKLIQKLKEAGEKHAVLNNFWQAYHFPEYVSCGTSLAITLLWFSSTHFP